MIHLGTISPPACINMLPKKKRVLRGNKKSYKNKNLRRAIMKRSKLKNEANKTNKPLDLLNYKK